MALNLKTSNSNNEIINRETVANVVVLQERVLELLLINFHTTLLNMIFHAMLPFEHFSTDVARKFGSIVLIHVLFQQPHCLKCFGACCTGMLSFSIVRRAAFVYSKNWWGFVWLRTYFTGVFFSSECELKCCWSAYPDWHGFAHTVHEYFDALPRWISFSCLLSQYVVVNSFPHWLQTFGPSVWERVWRCRDFFIIECFSALWKIALVCGITMNLHAPL